MDIILHSLRFNNFKGSGEVKINFDRETNIYAANGVGKTRIADAWYWLLFGKSSNNSADFNIKNTVDASLNRMDHEVEAVLFIDGEETTIKRVYRENWVKKRGATESKMDGNETDYFWNDTPQRQKDFQAKITRILEESHFRLITDPARFNALKWEDRRSVLVAMAGNITPAEIAGSNPDFQRLLTAMGKETAKDYKAKLAARRKKSKEELDQIPARIDELFKSIPNPEPDFATLHSTIDQKATELNDVDGLLMNKTQAQKKFQDDQSAIQKKLHQLNRNLADLKHKLRTEIENSDRSATSEIDATKQSIRSIEAQIKQLKQSKSNDEQRVAGLDAELQRMREDYKKINAEVFEYPAFEWTEDEESCPTCKQHLPPETIDTRKAALKKNYDEDRAAKETVFNNSKLRRKQDNEAAGKNKANLMKEIKEAIASTTTTIGAKENELALAQNKLAQLESQFTAPRPVEDRLTEILDSNKESLSILAAIEAQEALIKEEPAEDNADLKERKTTLANELTELNKKLGQKDTITSTKKRIEELKSREKVLAQEVADAQGEEDILARFEKARIEAVNSLVNSKFKFVTFKMFDYTIEGGEFPVCETLLDGVPYSDLNTAGKMKAGIDIINALCDHYGVRAPIFIDNRESITAIPDTDSQVINLIVSPLDKKLRIESAKMEEAV